MFFKIRSIVRYIYTAKRHGCVRRVIEFYPRSVVERRIKIYIHIIHHDFVDKDVFGSDIISHYKEFASSRLLRTISSRSSNNSLTCTYSRNQSVGIYLNNTFIRRSPFQLTETSHSRQDGSLKLECLAGYKLFRGIRQSETRNEFYRTITLKFPVVETSPV